MWGLSLILSFLCNIDSGPQQRRSADVVSASVRGQLLVGDGVTGTSAATSRTAAAAQLAAVAADAAECLLWRSAASQSADTSAAAAAAAAGLIAASPLRHHCNYVTSQLKFSMLSTGWLRKLTSLFGWSRNLGLMYLFFWLSNCDYPLHWMYFDFVTFRICAIPLKEYFW